ncbi:MAG TPA: Ppx/GppA phosphatase family protein [Egibacteraceae bacterium]|nr:Ppx/GppA phosphatase family protein [Egibacteraceae bacterium]
MRVAAVDVGTNSVRLLVAEPGDPLTDVARETRITRLGRGVDATGRLDDAALARTLDCIADYAQRWAALGAARVRVTATSAVRDAADRERFFEGVQERAGVRPDVLTGEEEARTTFAGATRSVAGEPPYLVLDIGGGSTELIVGDERPEAMVSRQLGSVRLTESCLGADPPTPEQLDAAGHEVDRHLAAIADRIDPTAARTLIGVAGTVTTVAALHLELASYQPERVHGTRVPADRVRELTEELARMPAQQIASLGPMAPGREDVIVGGALILHRVMARYGFDEVLASEADILDGLALELLAG